MRTFFIIYNRTKNNAKIVADRLNKLLLEKGCNSLLNDVSDMKEPYLYTNPEHIPKSTDCIITIGGDGTLIRAARDTASLNIPLIGVNTGHLGFLAQIEEKSIDLAVEKLIEGRFYIEDRIRLELNVFDRVRNKLTEDSALNDIVLFRKGFSGVLGINLYVNGQHLNNYNADGIIISTPTGSTGYSLSAGGPVIEPVANMILITPINPHTMNSRSVVLSGDSVIEMELSERSFESGTDGVMVCDGEKIGTLSYGMLLKVSKSNHLTKIVKLNKTSFIKILRNKMKDE